jgi:hypothetical protein
MQNKARHALEDAFYTHMSTHQLSSLLDAYKIEVIENTYPTVTRLLAKEIRAHFESEYPDQFKTGVMAAAKFLENHAEDAEL